MHTKQYNHKIYLFNSNFKLTPLTSQPLLSYPPRTKAKKKIKHLSISHSCLLLLRTERTTDLEGAESPPPLLPPPFAVFLPSVLSFVRFRLSGSGPGALLPPPPPPACATTDRWGGEATVASRRDRGDENTCTKRGMCVCDVECDGGDTMGSRLGVF